jgi:hypothetical protein
VDDRRRTVCAGFAVTAKRTVGSEGIALARAEIFDASAGKCSDRVVLATAAMCGPLLRGVAARARERVVTERCRRLVPIGAREDFFVGRGWLEVLRRKVVRRIAAGVGAERG